MNIDPVRLAERIQALARHGRTPEGGVNRPVYSSAWLAARTEVAGWMRDLGLHVRIDAVGSLFGRTDAEQPDAPVILTGSHLDSVPNGGAFDGALGIHAGLFAVEALLARAGGPHRPIEILATCEEEGARFPSHFWAARAITGAIEPGEAELLRDAHGMTLAEAMRACGLDPEDIGSAARANVAAFLELHIEQGPQLEQAGVPLGIVDRITGQRRWRVLVRGRADHAGGAPMLRRRDALAGAAEMALQVEALARALGHPAVATVGSVEIRPNAVNIVPGEAVFTIDVRHPDEAQLIALDGSIVEGCTAIAGRRELQIEWATEMDISPRPMDPVLRDLVARCADDLRVPWMPMHSAAGHDAQVMAGAFPTAMLFVPSHDGRSHAPDEWTPTEQIVPGIQVLAEMLRRLAYSP